MAALQCMWRKVVKKLELSRPQSMRIVELRDLFLSKTAETQLRRKAAAQQLAEALPQVRRSIVINIRIICFRSL